jgi:hypothetical protein
MVPLFWKMIIRLIHRIYLFITVWNEILATRFLKGKLDCQVGSQYTQNVDLAA